MFCVSGVHCIRALFSVGGTGQCHEYNSALLFGSVVCSWCVVRLVISCFVSFHVLHFVRQEQSSWFVRLPDRGVRYTGCHRFLGR